MHSSAFKYTSWCLPVISVSGSPNLDFRKALVGSVLIGWCMYLLRTGVLYGTVFISLHSSVPGNSRCTMLKIVMGSSLKLGTLEGVCSPIGPAILPLYRWPMAYSLPFPLPFP